MTMLNSQKINTDPLPWKCSEHADPCRDTERSIACTDRDPRPEFDNKPNPILVNFRAIDAGRNEFAEWVRDFDEHPEHWQGKGMYSREHIDHARKVLERLARST